MDLKTIILWSLTSTLKFNGTSIITAILLGILKGCEVMTEINFTPAKLKQIALARLDLVHKWLEFRRKSTNKLQADYDFVKLHNTSNSNLLEILGKISRGNLHRWRTQLSGTDD